MYGLWEVVVHRRDLLLMGPFFPSLNELARVNALAMTEAVLDLNVLKLWRAHGWRLEVPPKKGAIVQQLLDPYHTHDARRSPKGFPDRVAIRPPRLVAPPEVHAVAPAIRLTPTYSHAHEASFPIPSPV